MIIVIRSNCFFSWNTKLGDVGGAKLPYLRICASSMRNRYFEVEVSICGAVQSNHIFCFSFAQELFLRSCQIVRSLEIGSERGEIIV
jgi:hypothetical protein